MLNVTDDLDMVGMRILYRDRLVVAPFSPRRLFEWSGLGKGQPDRGRPGIRHHRRRNWR